MEELIQLLKQIEELAGVGIDALGEATKGHKPGGDKPEGGPQGEGGPHQGPPPGGKPGGPDQGPPPEEKRY